MRNWEYIGDERKIRALEFAEDIIEQNRYPGVIVTDQAIWDMAKFLFPEVFASSFNKLRTLANPCSGITL